MSIKSEKIELIDIDILVPYKKNMNKHTEDQIKRLCDLIEYQGFRDPIIAQKGTNIIAAGHCRLEAAKRLGLKKIPVIYQEFDNEAQFYAFVVSHNAIGSWSELDLDKIKNDYLDFPDLDIEMLGLENFSILDMATEEEEIEEEKADDKKYVLQVELPSELELRDLYDDLISKGYMVKEL